MLENNNVENLTKTCINLLKDIADIILSQSIKIFALDNSSVSVENLLEINDRLMLSLNMLKNYSKIFYYIFIKLKNILTIKLNK